MLNFFNQLGLGLVVQLVDQVTNPAGTVRKSLQHMRLDAQSLTTSFQTMQRQMWQGMKFMAAGGAIAAPFLVAGKAAASFEDELGAIRSLLATTMQPADVELASQAIQRTILETGRNSRIANLELATSYYKLQSAIGDVVQTQAALKPAADLAVAGLGTMDESVKTMTSLLATYGKAWGDILSPEEKAIKIANIMAGSIAAFNTTLPEMSEALTYAAGPAKVLGVRLHELTSVMGAAQTAGLQGTVAGTAFSEFLRQAPVLVKENGETMDSSTLTMAEYLDQFERGAKVMGKMSLQQLGLTDQNGMLLSFFDILKKIEVQFGITPEKAKAVTEQGLEGAAAFEAMGIKATYAAALIDAFGARGSRIIQVLLGQADALKEQAKQIEISNNLEAMLAERQNTSMARWAMMKNRIKEFAITIGGGLLPQTKELINQFGQYVLNAIEWVKMNPEIVSAVTKASLAVAGLTAAIGGATIAWALINAAFISTPVGWIVMGLAAIGAGIYMLITRWQEIKNTALAVLTWLRIAVAGVPDWLLWLAPPLLILKHWDKIYQGIKWFIEKIWSYIKWFFDQIGNAIESVPGLGWILKDLGSFLGGLPEKLGITHVAETLFGAPKKVGLESIPSAFPLARTVIPYPQPLQASAPTVVNSSPTIHVHAAPGMDVTELSRQVVREIKKNEPLETHGRTK